MSSYEHREPRLIFFEGPGKSPVQKPDEEVVESKESKQKKLEDRKGELVKRMEDMIKMDRTPGEEGEKNKEKWEIYLDEFKGKKTTEFMLKSYEIQVKRRELEIKLNERKKVIVERMNEMIDGVVEKNREGWQKHLEHFENQCEKLWKKLRKSSTPSAYAGKINKVFDSYAEGLQTRETELYARENKKDIEVLQKRDEELSGEIEGLRGDVVGLRVEDTRLEQKIDTEAANREKEDKKLNKRIDTEATNREKEDEALRKRGDELDEKIDTEVGDLEAADVELRAEDTRLEQKMDTEVEGLKEADQTIRNDLDAAVESLEKEDERLAGLAKKLEDYNEEYAAEVAGEFSDLKEKHEEVKTQMEELRKRVDDVGYEDLVKMRDRDTHRSMLEAEEKRLIEEGKRIMREAEEKFNAVASVPLEKKETGESPVGQREEVSVERDEVDLADIEEKIAKADAKQGEPETSEEKGGVGRRSSGVALGGSEVSANIPQEVEEAQEKEVEEQMRTMTDSYEGIMPKKEE